MTGTLWEMQPETIVCNELALSTLFFCSFLSTPATKTTLYGVECSIIAKNC
jgi:hypothetical protein